MVLDGAYLKRLKEIFKRGYNGSLKYSKKKQELLPYIKGSINAINSKLNGSDFGNNLTDFLAEIKKKKVFPDFKEFGNTINLYLKQGSLSKDEIYFLWILHSKDFRSFKEHELTQFFILLDKEAVFIANAANFLNNLKRKFITQTMRNSEFEKFLKIVQNVLPDILNLKASIENQRSFLNDSQLGKFLSKISNEKKIKKELYLKVRTGIDIPSRKEFLEQAAGLAAIFLLGLNSIESFAQSAEQLGKAASVSNISYKRKYQTIGHEFLDLEKKEISDSGEADYVVTADEYELLDEIIDEAKARIKAMQTKNKIDKPFKKYNADEAVDIVLKTIASILDEKGFTTAPILDWKSPEYPEQVLLSERLKICQDRKRHVDCDGLSVIYLSIAEILDLPMAGVHAPRHFFVRWHFNKKEYINWETTVKIREIQDDRHYKESLVITEEAIKTGAYLASLYAKKDRKKILALCYYNIGVYWFRKGEEQGLKDALPTEIMAYNKYFDKSIGYFERAIKLNPKFYNTYIMVNRALGKKAVALHMNAQFPEVEYYYKKRLKLKAEDCGKRDWH